MGNIEFKNRNNLNENYAQLAYAIVIQAIRDYEDALCRLHKRPKSHSALKMLKDCEDFFLNEISYYFDYDGKMIMQKVQKIVEENGYVKSNGKIIIGELLE